MTKKKKKDGGWWTEKQERWKGRGGGRARRGGSGQELLEKLCQTSARRRRGMGGTERILEDSENWENIKEHMKSPEEIWKRGAEKQATHDVAEKKGGKDE